MRTVIPVENGDALAAVRGFLGRLLVAGVVDALLVPMETPAGPITPALVTDVDLLEAANPLAPVMGLNAARLAGQVSVREPRGRVGAILRPCELRALMELTKLKQAVLDDLVTIGVDCLGTFDVPVYNALHVARAGRVNAVGVDSIDGVVGAGLDMEALLATAQTGDLALPPGVARAGYDLRDACQMCEKPHVEQADMALELYGADLTAGIPIRLPDPVAATLGLVPAAGDSGRAEVVQRVVAARRQVRDARLAEISERLNREGLQGVLAACVRCHNCMTVCPICYCKTCLFRSAVFDHEPMAYLKWARQKGAYRLPADTLLFHLTRLNHMALSCVGCGMCTSACPAELPVGRVFRAVAERVQALFDYAPGRDVEEPLPMVTFREDEWMEVGEE